MSGPAGLVLKKNDSGEGGSGAFIATAVAEGPGLVLVLVLVPPELELELELDAEAELPVVAVPLPLPKEKTLPSEDVPSESPVPTLSPGLPKKLLKSKSWRRRVACCCSTAVSGTADAALILPFCAAPLARCGNRRASTACGVSTAATTSTKSTAAVLSFGNSCEIVIMICADEV